MGNTFRFGEVLMPWRETSVMDERIRFVVRLLEGERMSDGTLSSRAFENLKACINAHWLFTALIAFERLFNGNLANHKPIGPYGRKRKRQSTSDVEPVESEDCHFIGDFYASFQAMKDAADGHVVVRIDDNIRLAGQTA
jgi:hypothetical protein